MYMHISMYEHAFDVFNYFNLYVCVQQDSKMTFTLNDLGKKQKKKDEKESKTLPKVLVRDLKNG